MGYQAEAKKITSLGSFAGAFAAGGAVTSVFTNTEINDVDVYFKTKEDFERAVEGAYEDGLWCVSTSKRAVTFADANNIIQFMYFDFFSTAQDIFKAFDYTVVMGAFDYDSGEFVLHDDFLKHNAQRFLRFNAGTRYPLASATRVLKYQGRGYTIGRGDVLKIALACRGVKIDSWEDLKDQIGGAYGEKVLLGSAGQEFSLSAAIDALTVSDDGADLWVANDNESQPGNSKDLLAKLAEMHGEPFDDTRFDEDGYLIAA